VPLDVAAGLLEIPAGYAGEQIHARAAAALVVFAAALVAVPAAISVVLVPPVAILPATGWAGLVGISELIS
jgi:hypothetical protein